MATAWQKILLAGALTGLALFSLFEVGMAFPVPGWMYLLLGAAFLVALLRPGKIAKQNGRARLLLATVWSGIAVVYWVDWSTRKPFLRALDQVRAGMTESEVRTVMKGYLEGTGWPAIPEYQEGGAGKVYFPGSAQPLQAKSTNGELAIQNALIFRHSNEGAFNADWGIVIFDQGRVVEVRFSPD